MALGEYLSHTPVRHWARRHIGRCRLWQGILRTTRELGLIHTIFEDLGGVYPKRGKRFMVKDAYRAFRRGSHRRHFRKLERYIHYLKERRPLEVVVTIGRIKRGKHKGLVIADGNTRAIAWYEAYKKVNTMPLLVYLMEVEK